jgi:hypothetical protein
MDHVGDERQKQTKRKTDPEIIPIDALKHITQRLF